jgi:photosystem II stability/assembly factor-like uncharacterized protein
VLLRRRWAEGFLIFSKEDRMPIFAKRMSPAFLVPLLPLLATPVFAETGRWSLLGPDGGTVTALAVDPVHPRVVYAGTREGEGVFKSLDGGATWNRSGAGLPRRNPAGVVALAIDSQRPEILYAGTTNAGVFKSADGGGSWSQIRQGMPVVPGVRALATDPRTSGTVYALTDSVPFKSTDGGAHWRVDANGLLAAPRVLAIDPRRPRVIYAGVDEIGVSRSTDGGETWAPTGPGLPPEAVFSALVVSPERPGTVYAATSSGVFRSVDGGATWTPAGAGLPASPSLPLSALAIDPKNPRVLFAGTLGAGVFRSDDAGASWSPASAGLSDSEVRALAIHPQGAVLYAGTTGGDRAYQGDGPGGVFQTTDGRTWRRTVRGLVAVKVTAVAAGPEDRPVLWAGTENLGLFRSLNGGITWRSVPLGVSGAVTGIAADPNHPGTAYVTVLVTDPPGNVVAEALFKTTDSGRTWSRLPPSPTLLFYGLELAPRTSALWRFLIGIIERSTDGGLTWTGSSAGIGAADVVSTMAFDPADPRVLYAGGYLLPVSHLDTFKVRLYRSADGGATWTRIDAGLPADGGIQKVLVSPVDSRTLYAADGGLLFRSTDTGVHWEPVAATPQYGSFTDLVAAPDGTLYAATSNAGVYTSRDGVSWTRVNGGLASFDVDGLALAPAHPDTLYAATASGGVEVSNP